MISRKCKKFISAIMLMMLMVSVLPCVNVFADDLTGSCGDGVTYSFDEPNRLLTISGEGRMNDYSKENRAPWDSYHIKRVIIDDLVNNIGERAFSHCNSLKSIEIGENVSSIGDYAFSCCENLRSVAIPEHTTTIGAHAFTHCTRLESLDVTGPLWHIGDYAFSCCRSLKNVTYGDMCKPDAGKFVFHGCLKLTRVKVKSCYEGHFFCGIIATLPRPKSPGINFGYDACQEEYLAYKYRHHKAHNK